MPLEIITEDGELVPMMPSLGPLVLPRRTSLYLAPSLTEEEWREAGRALTHTEQNISWWIGDWWAFGKAKYGQRKAVVEADGWEGPQFQTCADAAAVCRAFETSRRREVLSFKHHREVAALPPSEADRLLDWAQEPSDKPRSTRELRAAVHKLRVTVGAQPSGQTCTITDLSALAETGQRFGCIYADPPWLYDNQATRAATGNHYSGLTVEQLCELPIRDLAAKDAHLHLWITNAFLFDALRIFEAWGFEFRSTFIWAKPQMGIGNYWRNSHEIMLTAIRGDAKRFNDHSMMSWLKCDRSAHSAKPEQVRAMVERASPGPYLELFGRLPASGWTVWGNQIERNLFMPGDAA